MIDVLFLDDCPNRRKKFRSACPSAKIVETAEEAIAALAETKFDVVFLDHDLSGETYVDSDRKDTGMEVVRWMAENKPICGKVFLHTCNKDAGERMETTLVDLGYTVSRTPFPRINLDDLHLGNTG